MDLAALPLLVLYCIMALIAINLYEIKNRK